MTRGVFLATWLATGAVAFSASVLALNLTLPDPKALSAVHLPVLSALNSGETDTANDRNWPALFGTPARIEAAGPDTAPAPDTTFTLKGLIAGIDGGWAILDDGGSEMLIRKGDTLGDGSVVARIDRHGVILDLNGRMTNVSFTAPEAPGNASGPVRGNEAPGPRSMLSTRVDLNMSGLNATDMRRMLARGGAVTQVVLPDGTKALDVLWTRSGQFYEKLGLAAGDRLLTINGIEAGDNEALIQSLGELLSSDAFKLELIRNGERQAVTVKLVENG